MKTLKITGWLALGAALLTGATVLEDSTHPAGQEVAARYHLRQRTQRFFERSTPSGREAQQGIYQTMPRPAQEKANCKTTAVG